MVMTEMSSYCNVCLKKILFNVHFRCVKCNNYLLCPKCEKKINHKHPLLKIKSNAQSLSKILYIGIEDLPAHEMKKDLKKTEILNQKLNVLFENVRQEAKGIIDEVFGKGMKDQSKRRLRKNSLENEEYMSSEDYSAYFQTLLCNL